MSAGDAQLRNALKNRKRNAFYMSRETQNYLLELIAKQIKQKLVAEVKTVRFCSILQLYSMKQLTLATWHKVHETGHIHGISSSARRHWGQTYKALIRPTVD